jgi:hypothetical protein
MDCGNRKSDAIFLKRAGVSGSFFIDGVASED